MAPSPSRMSCMKKSPVTLLPMKRPCWSGNTMRTVSTSSAWISPSMSLTEILPLSMRSLSDRFQVPLDGGKLLRRALDLRPLEPLAGRDQPVDTGIADDRSHGDGCVVQGADLLQAEPARAQPGNHQDDADEHYP